MIMKLAGLTLLSLLLLGCMQNAMYYWDNYSQSLYNYKKNPTVEARRAHVLTLQKIVTKSDQLNKKTPPGLCVELALLEKNGGDLSQVDELLVREVNQYPESEVMVKFIRKALLGEVIDENKN